MWGGCMSYTGQHAQTVEDLLTCYTDFLTLLLLLIILNVVRKDMDMQRNSIPIQFYINEMLAMNKQNSTYSSHRE